MKMYLVKSLFLLAAIVIMVMKGIQFAEDGIHQMKGFENNVPLNFNSSQKEYKQTEYDPFSHDFAVKQKRLEKINAFNLFSYLGNKLSETVSNAVNNLITFITG